MILPLFRRKPLKRTITALYGAIVAQARLPTFYQRYGVPDTVLGRFDLLVLHLALVLRRLRGGSTTVQPLGQGVFDAFCRDMDDNLREMGISDQGVPRQMRRIGESFYGRARAYDAALDAGGTAELAATLARNVYADELQVASELLAAYVRETVDALEAQDLAELARGIIRFPDPAAIAQSAATAETAS